MLLNDIIQKHPAEKTAFIFKDQYTTYGEFRKSACSAKTPQILWRRILLLSGQAV